MSLVINTLEKLRAIDRVHYSRFETVSPSAGISPRSTRGTKRTSLLEGFLRSRLRLNLVLLQLSIESRLTYAQNSGSR